MKVESCKVPSSFIQNAASIILIQVRDILQGTVKNQELKFYEDLEAVARAAKASEIRKAGVRAGKLLKEILSGLAKDACIWASGRPETQGSGVGTTEESPVDCENVTDILRFARQQEADFIIREIRDPPLGVDGLSTSLRLRPIITSMLSHLRSKSSDLQPGSQGERQAWVVRRITPRNRCYICSSL